MKELPRLQALVDRAMAEPRPEAPAAARTLLIRELETDRLVLRPLQPDDLRALAELHADAELMKHLPGGVRTREQTAESLDRMWTGYLAQGFGQMAVVEQATGALIGRCGLVRQTLDGAEVLELTCLVARERLRRGFAREAALVLIDAAQGQLGGAQLVAFVRLENVAGAGLARALGFLPEREVPMHGELTELWALPTTR